MYKLALIANKAYQRKKYLGFLVNEMLGFDHSFLFRLGLKGGILNFILAVHILPGSI